MDYCTNKYLTLSRKLLVDHGNEELQTENKKMKESLIYIEKECFEKNENGPFWLGNKISLVDLHYAPFFERFGAFKELLVSNGQKNASKYQTGGAPSKREIVTK